MKIAYLECFAGISGDMFLGALLDAGVPLEVFEDAVQALDVGASLKVEKVDRSGISATKVHVLEHGRPAEAQAHAHPHAQTDQDQAEHDPARAHAHEHSHTHEHTHEHTREHDHAHEHSHTHQHQHAQEHQHTHGHDHAHDHQHEHTDPHAHAHSHGRSLTRIRELIRTARLPEPVKTFAIRTFEMLGASEARIHNVALDAIHFHEVGAVDAIVDIVAASAGLHHLQQSGALSWYCTAINVGSGMVECAHGTFPVPAPATADLLRGMPTYAAHVQKELVTPTGAALLRALAPSFSPYPTARVETIAYGAGTRNPHGFPNVLRLSIGSPVSAEDATPTHSFVAAPVSEGQSTTVAVLETAIDDANPQLLASVAEQALEAGALDVMLTPVIMKKGRPGTLLTLLANPASSAALEQLLLRETPTLGVRVHHQERSCLDRRHVSVATRFGDIRIKIGSLHGEELNAAPEFEDCRAVARAQAVPVKQVIQAATAAYLASQSR